MGFAFTLDRVGISLFFAVAGFGLAFPFLVIAFVPALIRFLPKPGAWMDTFKQAVGWTMMAVVVWLVVWIFGALSTRYIDPYKAITAVFCCLMATGLGAAFFGKYGSIIESGRRQLGALAGAACIGLLGSWISLDTMGWMERKEPVLVEKIDAPLVCVKSQ
jgi:thiol:disulfide interchange protein